MYKINCSFTNKKCNTFNSNMEMIKLNPIEDKHVHNLDKEEEDEMVKDLKDKSRCYFLYLSQKHTSKLLFFLCCYILYFLTQLILKILDTPDVYKSLEKYYMNRRNIT